MYRSISTNWLDIITDTLHAITDTPCLPYWVYSNAYERLALSPGPSPLLQAGEGLVTFTIKTVASCRRKKCSTNQIASFVRVTKRHVAIGFT